MKIQVRQTGVVEKDKDVNIRNPSATVGNMRAAIAIIFRLEPHSFRMVRDGVDLDDDKKLLSATGLKEMDVVQLVVKRPRDDDATDTTVAAAPSTATNPTSATAEAAAASDRPTIAAPPAARPTAAHAPVVPEADSFLEARLRADAEEEENQVDSDGSEGDDDENAEVSERDAEVGEMISQLLHVPNILDMRQQFLENPQQVLSQIQTSNPRLFQLIARHNEEFLEMVSNEPLLAALREEQMFEDEEAYIGEEDEELDSEAEAEVHQMILAALAGDAVDHPDDANALNEILEAVNNHDDGNDDTIDVDVRQRAFDLMRIGRRQRPQQSPGTSSTPGAEPTTGNATEPVATASTSQPRRVPEVISDEDNKKIEELMQLGFTKEQCTAAFFRCNRSIERAANMLFEGVPQL